MELRSSSSRRASSRDVGRAARRPPQRTALSRRGRASKPARSGCAAASGEIPARARAASAGGLAFYGTQRGDLKAVDAKTGKVLWQFNVRTGILTKAEGRRGLPDGRPRPLARLDASANPAQPRVVGSWPLGEIPLLHLGEVVRGKAGEFEQRLQAGGDPAFEVGRYRSELREVRRRNMVQPRGVQSEDVSPVGLRDLGVAPPVLQRFGDLEPPEGLVLPLWRAIPQRIGAEGDTVRAHVLQELAEDVSAHGGEGDHRRRERRADFGIDVVEVA